MPPKAQPGAARRGRPASNAVSEIPPSPKKRGRPAKADAVAAAAVEPPKKRGRPAKVQPDEPIAQIDQAIKRGRRSVAAAEEVVAEAPVPIKKRVGRPAKAAAVAEVATAPKKRGRPALHLNRVAGSPRVAKRTSPRSKTAARALPKAAAAPRINPKMRSRLRTRTAPVEKKIVVEPVKKARGRPKKVEVEEIPATKKASAPKKAVGHVRKASAPVPVAPAKKMTARSKTAAPRKRRGYTSFEVADKFAAQVKQYILDLQAEDAADAAAAAAGEADDEGEGIEVEVELGTEDATGHPDNLQAEAEVNELAAELAEDEEEDKDEHMLVDPMEIAQSVALDQEQLNRDTDGAAEMAPESDEFEDETELPSETAVLAEIAAVQDELGAQNDIEQDVEIAEAAQVELERGSSASHQSVDLHEEITEVSSIPQVDGSKEVEVFHTHIDEHNHVLNTPAPEPAAGASVGSLFSGF